MPSLRLFESLLALAVAAASGGPAGDTAAVKSRSLGPIPNAAAATLSSVPAAAAPFTLIHAGRFEIEVPAGWEVRIDQSNSGLGGLLEARSRQSESVVVVKLTTDTHMDLRRFVEHAQNRIHSAEIHLIGRPGAIVPRFVERADTVVGDLPAVRLVSLAVGPNAIDWRAFCYVEEPVGSGDIWEIRFGSNGTEPDALFETIVQSFAFAD